MAAIETDGYRFTHECRQCAKPFVVVCAPGRRSLNLTGPVHCPYCDEINDDLVLPINEIPVRVEVVSISRTTWALGRLRNELRWTWTRMRVRWHQVERLVARLARR